VGGERPLAWFSKCRELLVCCEQKVRNYLGPAAAGPSSEFLVNILIITNSYVPNAGGVATSVHCLATELRLLNWEVLVLTPQFNKDDGSDHHVQRLPLQEWDGAINRDFRILPGTELHDQVRRFSPDLIHVHGPFHLGPMATRLADDLKLPLVYTHHTKLEDFIHYCDDPNLTPSAVQAFYVDFANHCDAVLVPSGVVATELKQLGLQRPLYIVPSGLPPDWFVDSSAYTPQTTDRRVVGIVGRVTREKRSVELARTAMAYLREDEEADLLVIGDGDSLAIIRQEAEACNLIDRVRCTGLVEHDVLPVYLDQLDVVINAPETDTQCMVLLEAQARGVPVIASDIPLAREFVCNFAEDITFYASQDWEALQGSLIRFFALPNKSRVEIRNRVRAFVARFEQRALVRDLCLIYEDLQVELTCRHSSDSYGWVYRSLTRSLVPVIQKLREP